jgi:hypothetical protein
MMGVVMSSLSPYEFPENPGVFPGWDWTDLRWCQYCDEVRGKTAMRFLQDHSYICTVCLDRGGCFL